MFNSNPTTMSNFKRRWSQKEVAIANEHITADVPLTFNNPTINKVAELVGRSPESVCAKMTQVRINRRESTELSAEERNAAVLVMSRMLFHDEVDGELYFKLMRIIHENSVTIL
tara:strand:+ start:1314 stop:1655 length:342 start_codon:yes stop_codon:yes gene_type:complete